MKLKSLFFSRQLPKGYSIVIWKTNCGEKRYSLFWGDDRLMSFASKAYAVEYAIQVSNGTQMKRSEYENYTAALQPALSAR